MNSIISGDYKGGKVAVGLFGGDVVLMTGGFYSENIILSKSNVASCEVIDSTSRKSAFSAIARGTVGTMLLGPIGLAAALSAKSKGTYLVALEFRNGKKALVECDQKVYKAIVKALF